SLVFQQVHLKVRSRKKPPPSGTVALTKTTTTATMVRMKVTASANVSVSAPKKAKPLMTAVPAPTYSAPTTPVPRSTSSRTESFQNPSSLKALPGSSTKMASTTSPIQQTSKVN